jgi:hypothetical protein
MPLVRCPVCQAATPSAAIRCVHCGGLAPACSDCSGSGTCPDCATATAYGLGGVECGRCRGANTCSACSGQRRRWASAAPTGA